MRYVEGMSTAESAECLDITEETAKTRGLGQFGFARLSADIAGVCWTVAPRCAWQGSRC
jgi:hypothetical protein